MPTRADSFAPMSTRETVTFYLPSQLRAQAERGNHNFIQKMSEVLTASGLTIAFDDDNDLARLRAKTRLGRGIFLMDPPANGRGLTFRKTYIFPFWHLEKDAARWEWPVAKETFDPQAVDARKAANFYRFWRQRLFDEAPVYARNDGFVYVPLQGQLLRQRSFQTCSPLQMIETVLEEEPNKHIVVTLHPTETYSNEERQSLDAIVAREDRLTLGETGAEQYLQNCDYIVTQNSAVGFEGYFFGKPIILFGKSDFHHIALNVADMGAEEAFDRVHGHRPDNAAYLFWFLQMRAINAGRPEATKKIRNVFRNHGWPV